VSTSRVDPSGDRIIARVNTEALLLVNARPVFMAPAKKVERGAVDPRVSTIEAVQKALTKAGIGLITGDERKGEGVRFTRPVTGAR
jgi:hypothetical protein